LLLMLPILPPVSVGSSNCSSQAQPSIPVAWESSLLKW
jgi:hypothetical protein